MKSLTRPLHRTKLVAQAAAMSLILLLLAPITTVAESGMLIVAKTTNLHRYLGIGTIVKVSDHWAIVADAYAGGGLGAAQTQALLLLPLNKYTTLFACVGPELDVVQTNPTIDEKLYYLQHATTIGLSYRPVQEYSAWIAIDRLDGQAPTPTYKISIGLVLWFKS